MNQPFKKTNVYPCVGVKGQRGELGPNAPSRSFQLVKVRLAEVQEMWHCSSKSLCLYVALTAKTHTKKASENTKNTKVTFVHYDYPGSYPLTRQSSKSSALLMINWSSSCLDSRLPSSRLHASQSQLQAASSPQGSARATSANNNKGFSTSAKLLYIIVTERKKFYSQGRGYLVVLIKAVKCGLDNCENEW